jgi:flagellar basal body-associated protein FliL
MRLEMKRNAEVAQRKGLTVRTIVAVCWFALAAVIGYFLVNWMFENGIVTANFFYSQLFIPGTVDEIFIRTGLILFVVFILEFMAIMVFALTSSQARQKTGRARAEAQVHDPFDNYHYN